MYNTYTFRTLFISPFPYTSTRFHMEHGAPKTRRWRGVLRLIRIFRLLKSPKMRNCVDMCPRMKMGQGWSFVEFLGEVFHNLGWYIYHLFSYYTCLMFISLYISSMYHLLPHNYLYHYKFVGYISPSRDSLWVYEHLIGGAPAKTRDQVWSDNGWNSLNLDPTWSESMPQKRVGEPWIVVDISRKKCTNLRYRWSIWISAWDSMTYLLDILGLPLGNCR